MSYLNRTRIKESILAQAAKTRSHKFERVSAEVYEYLEGMVALEINRLVRLQPSMGKTIYPAIRCGKSEG